MNNTSDILTMVVADAERSLFTIGFGAILLFYVTKLQIYTNAVLTAKDIILTEESQLNVLEFWAFRQCFAKPPGFTLLLLALLRGNRCNP
jgi:hypothetical protein